MKISEVQKIELEDKTIRLLDIVKQFNESATYNDVVLFLIGQYSIRLEELQLNNVGSEIIMNNPNSKKVDSDE